MQRFFASVDAILLKALAGEPELALPPDLLIILHQQMQKTNADLAGERALALPPEPFFIMQTHCIQLQRKYDGIVPFTVELFVFFR